MTSEMLDLKLEMGSYNRVSVSEMVVMMISGKSRVSEKRKMKNENVRKGKADDELRKQISFVKLQLLDLFRDTI